MLVRSRTMENHSCVRPTPNVAVCGPGERLTHAARMGDKAKPLSVGALAALLFVVPRTLRRSPDLCILTWIKDADCHPVVGDYEPRSQ